MILIAFAIDTPDSLENVTVKVRHIQLSRCSLTKHAPPCFQWIEEVRSICGPTIPILLVGCKADLRPADGSPDITNYVTRAQAEAVAQDIGARAYKECSALKIQGVDDVFEAATRASMLMREGVPAKHENGAASDSDDGNGLKCCVVC